MRARAMRNVIFSGDMWWRNACAKGESLHASSPCDISGIKYVGISIPSVAFRWDLNHLKLFYRRHQ